MTEDGVSPNPLGSGAALAAEAAEAVVESVLSPAPREQKTLDLNNVPTTESEWRARFMEMLNADTDKQVFTRAKKAAFIEELQMLREKSLPPEAQRAAWNHARAYALLRNGEEWDLTIKADAKKTSPRPVAIVEDYFQIIKEAHERLQHQAIQATHREVRKTYAKVPRWAVEAYCQGCTTCRVKKRRRRTQDRVVTASVMHCNERWHLSHVDFEGTPDGEYKYIIHVLDHYSRFSMLRPAKTLDPVDVAECLYELVGHYGLPLIVQGSPKADDKLQVPEILEAFAALGATRGLSNAKILAGKPRASQTHAFVSAATRSVQGLVTQWVSNHDSLTWSRALSAMQYALNTSAPEPGAQRPMDIFSLARHAGIYGLNLPLEVITKIATEEQLARHVPGSVSSEIPPTPRKSTMLAMAIAEPAMSTGVDAVAPPEDAMGLSSHEGADGSFKRAAMDVAEGEAKRPRVDDIVAMEGV